MKSNNDKIQIDKDKNNDLTEKIDAMCQLIKINSLTHESNNNDVVKSIQINHDILKKLQDSNLKHLEFQSIISTKIDNLNKLKCKQIDKLLN